MPWEGEFHKRHPVAEALVLGKDWEGHTEAGLQEPDGIFMIILVCTLKIFLCQVSVSRDLLIHKTSQKPKLARILLRNGINYIVELRHGLLVVL